MMEQAELDALAPPIRAEQPCGDNLEDSSALSMFNGYRIFGQASAWETPPEWPQIRRAALDTLATSKDLRVLAHLGAAVLRTDGLEAFCPVLGVAAGWLERYWDGVYPLLEDDVLFRRNALSCFADRIAVSDAVRRSPLVKNRQLGSFSLRDTELAAGTLAPTEADGAAPSAAQIGGAFAAVPLEQLTTLEASVGAGLDALKRIESKMREAVGTEGVPDFEGLTTVLQRVNKVLREQRAARPDAGPEGAESGAAAVGGGAVGAIRSRQDAVRALDAVAQFFRQTEPSSPIPLFVERAKRLVSKSFIEVLEDVMPDAVAQARQVGGVREGE
jgi:type VI secretion system protein ImpA